MPAPAGATPTVSADYNSHLIDGMTSDQNNQGGPAGPGWSIGESFIERQYLPCGVGGEASDLCYASPNGTMSFGGRTNKLAPSNRYTQGLWNVIEYRTDVDAGWLIEHWTKQTQSSPGGFEDDALDSYWVATDQEGMQYWFGFGRSEGNPGDDPGTELHSVWTVPVYNQDEDDGCVGTLFCHQPYRWMLDRVVDPNGRVTTYHYGVDRNHYAQLGEASNPVPYVSGGFLERIEYGQLASTAGDANVEAARIRFDYSYRCSDTPDCAVAPTTATAASFPDIPVDQFCGLNATASSCTPDAPTFFSLRKLAAVTPERRTGPNPADWVGPITHRFGYLWNDADGADPDPARLFLRQIQRVETTTGSSFSPVRFDFFNSTFDNRVDFDIAEGTTSMRMARIDAVLDPNGSDVRVTYSAPDPGCVGDPGGWETNVKRCYPRYWVPEDDPASRELAIWHKYRVERVEVVDGLGISPTMVSAYDYLEPSESAANGGVAWHSDRVDYADPATLSWGEYRGYFEVTVTEGAATDPNRTVTTHRTFRGMDQDLLSHTAPEPRPRRPVALPERSGASWTDHDWLRGLPLDTSSSNSTGSVEYAGTVNTYASFLNGAIGGSYRVVPEQVRTRTEGGFHGLTSYTYDEQLRRVRTMTEWGDVDAGYANISAPGNSLHPTGIPDDRCTVYGYTPTTPRFRDGLANRETVVAGAVCDPSSAPVLSDTSTSYDGGSFGAAPAAGNATRVDRAVGDTTSVVASAGAATGVGVVTDLIAYEPNGYASTPGWSRVASVTDAAGVPVATSYESFAGGAPTVAGNHNTQTITETGPLGPASTNFDTRGLDVATTDVNGRVTRACYDVWLRVTEVWKPGESYSGCGTGHPSTTYAYVATNQTVTTAPLNAAGWQVQSWRVQTRTLMSVPGDPFHPSAAGSNANYIESYAYLDALGRAVETQTASPAGGRIVTRTAYDTRGLTVRTSEPFHVAGAPGTGRVAPTDWAIPRDNATTHDALQRPINVQLLNNGTAIRETLTSYDGRSTTTNPAKNVGTAATAASSTSTVDAYGRLTRVVEPLATTAATPAITTAYEYTMRDELERIIDTAGVQTVMSYNGLGWRTRLDDPNQGVSTSRYHRTGEIERTVDAKNQAITTEIDALGRPTNVRNGSAATSPLLADYLYDPAGNKGAVARTRSFWDPVLTDSTVASLLTMTETANAFDSRGRLTSSTKQVHGSPTSTHANYDNPTSTNDDRLFVPYTFSDSYTRNDLRWQHVVPAVTGAFSSEILTTRYSTLGLRATVETDDPAVAPHPADLMRRWVTGTTYDDIGRLTEEFLRGIEDVGIDNTVSYRQADGRVQAMTATILGGPNNGRRIRNATYAYDEPGNPVAIAHDPDIVADFYGGPPSTPDELASLDRRECYYYDARQRLVGGLGSVRNSSCSPNYNDPATKNNGPNGWKLAYSYDNQTRLTTFGTNRVYSYTLPDGPGAPGAPTGCVAGTQQRPHAPKAVNTTAGAPLEWFGFDCNGR